MEENIKLYGEVIVGIIALFVVLTTINNAVSQMSLQVVDCISRCLG